MRRRSDRARELMYRVPSGRVHRGPTRSLRESALLALIAGGLSAAEIAALRASAVSVNGGRVFIALVRRNDPQTLVLPLDHSTRVIAWLNDRCLWGTDALVFLGPRGPITRSAVLKHFKRRTASRRNR
jgi:hypothetical protein